MRPGRPKVNHRWQSAWTDVSFLNGEASNVKGQKIYGLYEAQFSLVISGSSEQQWGAYSFGSHDFDDEDSDVGDSEDDESEDEDSEGNDLQDGDSPFLEDPIAQLDANKPIYNPREYFLVVFQHRMVQVVEEWNSTVRGTERGYVLQQDQAFPSLSQGLASTRFQPKDVKKICDRTQRARELLSKLINVLSATINAWEMFNAQHGDICYFLDFDSSQATSRDSVYGCLRSINESFRELQFIQQKLILLQDSCRGLAKDVSQSQIIFFAIAIPQISPADGTSLNFA